MTKVNNKVLDAVFFGFGAGLLILVVYFIIRKFRSRGGYPSKAPTRKMTKLSDSARSRTVIPKDIPTFEIPGTLVTVPVQQPHRDIRGDSDPAKFAKNEYKPGLLPRSNHITLVQGSLSPPAAHRRRSSSLQLEEIMTASSANLIPRQRRKIAVHEKLPTKIGKLEFSVYYDLAQKLLNINVMRVSKIKRDVLPDTAIAVALVCKGKQLWHDKTRTVKRNFSPQFNQKLEAYGIAAEKIHNSVLQFLAYEEQSSCLMGEAEFSLDEFPNNKLINHICALESMDLTQEQEDEGDDVTDDVTYDGGDLKVKLCHNPSEQKLIVRIADAKNLPLVRGSKPDTFVKLEVHFCGRKLQSLTTKVVHKTQNPPFNEIFILDLSNDKMPQVTLVFKVKHKGRVRETHIGQFRWAYVAVWFSGRIVRNKNELTNRMANLPEKHGEIWIKRYNTTWVLVHLGYSVSVESEYRHWEQVVEKPQMAVEATHKIRKDR